MALTWKDVAAPNFSGAAASQQAAASALNSGFGAIQSALATYEQNKLNQAKFADEHRRSLLGDQTVSLTNAGLETTNAGRAIANNANQFALDATKRDDTQAQNRLAAQPEAAKIYGQARMLATSGNPADVERGRELLMKNTDLLVRSGINGDAIPGLLDGERTAGKEGFVYKKDVLENEQFWEAQGISKKARDIANTAIGGFPIPGMSIRSIQESSESPLVKAQAIKMITQAADEKVYPEVSKDEQYLTSIGRNPNLPTANVPDTLVRNPAAAEKPVTNSQRDVQQSTNNPLVSLVDRTEGGGKYTTLFGHAQDKNTPFAGVDITRMSLNQLTQLDKEYGPWVKNKLTESGQRGRIATPMGRFQIVGDTRRQVAAEMGLSGDTLFTPEVQNAMFNHLANKRISGPRTMEGKIAGLRQEWEGFKSVSNSELSAAITAFENGDTTSLVKYSGDQNVVSSPDSNPTSTSIDNFPRVDPNGTAANQAYQRQQRLNAINTSIANMTSDLDGGIINSTTGIGDGLSSLWDHYTATPEEGDARATERQKSRDAANFLSENADFLRQNPAEIEAAQKDPLAYVEAFGNTPAQEKWLSSKEASQLANSAQAAKTDSTDTKAQLDSSAASNIPAREGATNVQTLLNQSTVDRTRNVNGALIKEFVSAANSKETEDQVAGRLTSAEGPIPSGNRQAVLEAIRQTMKMGPGLNAAAAGAIVANNMEQRDVRPGWSLNPLNGFSGPSDPWLNEKENSKAAFRTNMEGVQRTLKDLGQNVDGSIDMSKATSQISGQQISDVAATELPKIQEFLLAASSEAATLRREISRGNDTPAIREALAIAEEKIRQFQAIVGQIGAAPGSPTTIFTDAAKGLPVK